MSVFRFQNVCIESFTLHLPELEVSSAELEDKLAPVYERLRVPFGTLEKVSGVKTRRLWEPAYPPSAGATVAAEQAIDQIGFDKDKLGALFSCSVTRDFFEPGVSSLVHGNLGLPEKVFALDITNACIGFSNGIQLLGNLIETGVVQAGIIVSGENIGRIVESSIRVLVEDEDLTREQLLRNLPTLTLGCGAAAMVLCHKDIATNPHKIIGCVSRTASQHNHLCKGNGDFPILQRLELNPVMHTESQGLIGEAAKLGRRMWEDYSESIGWSREEIDHIFCHQVGRQVNQAFYNEMTLDMNKEFTVYQRFGNLVSASLPAALYTGIKEKGIESGEKILLTAFGSGLNSIFLGLEW